jgi:hypothetical protein
MKKICKREREVVKRSVTEGNAEITRLRDEITNLRGVIQQLTSQNFDLVQSATCDRGHWVEAECRVTQLNKTLQSINVELPAYNPAQVSVPASSPVPCSMDGCKSKPDSDGFGGDYESEAGQSLCKRKRAAA